MIKLNILYNMSNRKKQEIANKKSLHFNYAIMLLTSIINYIVHFIYIKNNKILIVYLLYLIHCNS